MSFLAPLYLLGALALSLPIIFHLIRRSPRGRTVFSSLMFLGASPPRMTRRSRLDDLLLLLLRCAALTLLALAFARPLLRTAAPIAAVETGARRTVVLLDTSASMRRADLRDRALARLDAAVRDLGPAEPIALLAFDEDVRTLVSFEAAAGLAPGQRAALLRDRARAAVPGWRGTDLGLALVAAADAVLAEAPAAPGADGGDGEGDGGRRPVTGRIVAITDLQRGSRLEALASARWPANVSASIERVTTEGTNASISLLDDRDRSHEDSLRVRVSNEPDAAATRFAVAWAGGGATNVGDDRVPSGGEAATREVEVPPGQVRILSIPRPHAASGLDRLVVRGDDHPFDDECHVAPRPRREVPVLWVGDDRPDDPEGLRFWAERALLGDARREIRWAAVASTGTIPDGVGSSPRLVIVGSDPDPGLRAAVLRLVDSGATALWVLRDASAGPSVAAALGAPDLRVSEARPRDHDLLGEVDFAHPLFRTFSDPRFADFTRIRFWKHRRLELPAADSAVKVIARFDGGDPALLEKRLGRGRVLVLASGWHPADSQLALSTKFVPFLCGLIEDPAEAAETASFHAGEPVPLPPVPEDGVQRRIRKPDGAEVAVDPDAAAFEETDQPGVYSIEDGRGSMRFAVNLSPAESRTAPLDISELERLGVRFEAPAASAAARRRHVDEELEGAQKAWRWLLVAALGVLLIETWLAGRRARTARTEVSAT